MVQQQCKVPRLVDETRRRTVVSCVEILRLGGIDHGLFKQQLVIVLDVVNACRHLHAAPFAGQGQAECDVFRHVQPISFSNIVKVLVQSLGQKNVCVVLDHAVAAKFAHWSIAGNERQHCKGVGLVSLDQIHPKLHRDAVSYGKFFGLVGGGNEKRLSSGLMHADCELATFLLKIAVSSTKIELLPAFDLVVIKVVDYIGFGCLVQG